MYIYREVSEESNSRLHHSSIYFVVSVILAKLISVYNLIVDPTNIWFNNYTNLHKILNLNIKNY